MILQKYQSHHEGTLRSICVEGKQKYQAMPMFKIKNATNIDDILQSQTKDSVLSSCTPRYTTKIFTSSEKKTFKSKRFKKVFVKFVYYWYNLLRRMLFIPHDNWNTYFCIQISRYVKVWYNCHVFLP